MVGIERLVYHRGPKQTESPLGKALLKNICYGSVRNPWGYTTAGLTRICR